MLCQFSTLRLHSVTAMFNSSAFPELFQAGSGSTAGAYPRFKKVGDESWRARETRRRGCRAGSVRRGCPLPTRGGVCGGGYAPIQILFSIFELKMASFGAFWELILLQ